MTEPTVMLQVWRLENTTTRDAHYTAFLGPDDTAFFGFGKRTANTWQWSIADPKPGRAGDIVMRKLNEKRNGGYNDAWHGDVAIPVAWLSDPAANGHVIKGAVENVRHFGEQLYGEAVGTPVSEQPQAQTAVVTPLSGLLTDARRTVSKMAVDPDSAMAEYAALVADVEAAREDLSVAEDYIDTLKIMLVAGEAKTA